MYINFDRTQVTPEILEAINTELEVYKNRIDEPNEELWVNTPHGYYVKKPNLTNADRIYGNLYINLRTLIHATDWEDVISIIQPKYNRKGNWFFTTETDVFANNIYAGMGCKRWFSYFDNPLTVVDSEDKYIGIYFIVEGENNAVIKIIKELKRQAYSKEHVIDLCDNSTISKLLTTKATLTTWNLSKRYTYVGDACVNGESLPIMTYAFPAISTTQKE